MRSTWSGGLIRFSTSDDSARGHAVDVPHGWMQRSAWHGSATTVSVFRTVVMWLWHDRMLVKVGDAVEEKSQEIPEEVAEEKVEETAEEEAAEEEEEEAPVEEEEEEEVVDPKAEIEESCKPKCVKQLLALQACEKRVEEDEEGQKHCTGQYFDYWGCIDKCTAPKLFRKLK